MKALLQQTAQQTDDEVIEHFSCMTSSLHTCFAGPAWPFCMCLDPVPNLSLPGHGCLYYDL